MLLRCHAFAAQRGLRRGLGGQATLALCAALMGALTAHAGAASLRISQYQKQSWQVENGRPTGNVRAIVQTPDGMLLIASSAGMVSFDGRGIVARHANGSTVSLSYQTLWFRLLLLVPLCLLAVKLFRWRVARVKGELGVVLEERYRIARDWHDTLMAEFAAISWQLESTVRLLREDSVGGKHRAAQSCELARSMVSHCQAEARRIIWDLRESDHATPMLSEALSRTLSATATEDRIDMQLRVIGKEVPLAQRYIHHLVCIGQEAVTNALRHAQPKTISIRLDYADTELKISVRDDGCGFRSSTSANVTLGHFGIPVMEERARKLGGTLQVETATGSGTEVLVSIPFQMPTLSAGAKA